MFKIEAWENGVVYNVTIDRLFAITLKEALSEALNAENNTGYHVADNYEIDVEIKDKD